MSHLDSSVLEELFLYSDCACCGDVFFAGREIVLEWIGGSLIECLHEKFHMSPACAFNIVVEKCDRRARVTVCRILKSLRGNKNEIITRAELLAVHS